MRQEIDILSKYIPDAAVEKIWNLLQQQKKLTLKISKRRTSKLGDYRKLNWGRHQITVNQDLNPYQFLLTLLHELAHYYTYKKYGRHIKPHGVEWKGIFGELITEFNQPEIFPSEIIPLLNLYAQNPKASTSGDGKLFVELSKYDKHNNEQLKYVFELNPGTIFKMENGQIFELKEKRRTRYSCLNIQNHKKYLIHQNAKVLPVEKINRL